ncbi:hypothetical protein CONLIGDRAFT_661675 [Coniochaeta ligniaria NRRL 30616]|uniref:Amidohydrolase-related domain-containing protein n=1 Tax=Coniochaeta ligniaria NRRL 30616 TaxID=1408157 RepID=A0A1J7JAK7_9PEZI|nr:hypothetical protein CONLIGDRAFT_661675 [Coniochaeta ligniaria NRRL 30616]
MVITLYPRPHDMKLTLVIELTALVFLSAIGVTNCTTYPPKIENIIKAASRDGIDLLSLPFASEAFDSITAIGASKNTSYIPSNASRIDVHVHVVPDFYRRLAPNTAGLPTPSWDVAGHLQAMMRFKVSHGVVSISLPGANVFQGNQAYTAGLARLLNEWMAELVRTFPERFSFFAVMPLPYTRSAITELKHALGTLNARGIGLLTNHEGVYLGNPTLTPFFSAVNGTKGGPHVCFVHPAIPLLRVSNGSLIEANPTVYATGLVEFYFETARAIMDLTASQTLTNFTNIRYSFSHGGGAFPSIEDRFLKSFSVLEGPAKAAYGSRVWYDSAGPTYFNQIKGLLGYGVPTSQLVFGTDFPYAPAPIYGPSIAALENASFLTDGEKRAIFKDNAEHLFDGRFR